MKEIYPLATFYGHGQILKKYASFPNFLPCSVSVQHGWTILANPHDARYDAPENWYWSSNIENQYKQKFEGLKTRTVGAPFIYKLSISKYTTPKNQQGSIVFPSHSSKFIDMLCDFEEYADMLVKLPDEYKPISVCMYYIDMEKGLDKPFRERGFEIVTNGDGLYSNDFLDNFIKNVKGKKYAFSNQMTSALLFASSMGLVSFFYGPEFKTSSRDSNYKNLDYNEHHRKWERQYIGIFSFPDCDIKKQKKFVLEELGNDFVLSPSQMRSILWKSVLTKKYFSKAKTSIRISLQEKAPAIYKLFKYFKNRVTHNVEENYEGK